MNKSLALKVSRTYTRPGLSAISPMPDLPVGSRAVLLPNKGTWAIVDTKNYPLVMQFRWRQDGGGYVVRQARDENRKPRLVAMHRLLTDAPASLVVDHINGNPLDNRLANLRVCTSAQNLQNSKNSIIDASEGDLAIPGTNLRVKGVSRIVRNRRTQYLAHICVNKKVIRLGYFDTAIEAAKQYNLAAPYFHGEFARLNDLSGVE